MIFLKRVPILNFEYKIEVSKISNQNSLFVVKCWHNISMVFRRISHDLDFLRWRHFAIFTILESKKGKNSNKELRYTNCRTSAKQGMSGGIFITPFFSSFFEFSNAVKSTFFLELCVLLFWNSIAHYAPMIIFVMMIIATTLGSKSSNISWCWIKKLQKISTNFGFLFGPYLKIGIGSWVVANGALRKFRKIMDISQKKNS